MQIGSKNNENNEQLVSKLYLLLLKNFIQYLVVVDSIFIPKENSDRSISSLFDFSIGDIYAFFSLECFLQSKLHLFYIIKLILGNGHGLTDIQAQIILSIGFPFLLSIIFSIKNLFKKKLNIFEFCFYFIVSCFVFQQKIFMKLFEMINCENFIFDDQLSEFYLRNYLHIKCYTQDHYFWVYYIIVPSLVFYGIHLPISIWIFTYYNQSRFRDRNINIKYNFLMRQEFKLKNTNW